MRINSDTCSFRRAISWTVSSWGELPLVDISIAGDLVTMGSRHGDSLACFLLAIFWSRESRKWKKWSVFDKVETKHQNQVSLCSWYLTCTYHFLKNLTLHLCSGTYYGEFLLWCKINAQDWQVIKNFMICSTMWEGPFLWLHACTKFAFTTLSSSAPIMGLLQYKKCDCEEKLDF